MKSATDNKFGLKSSYIDLICHIFKNHLEVDKVILYGSRAMGNYKPYSDIDISLVGEKIDLSVQNKIENELDDLLLPYKFDVSVFNKIQNQELLDHITRVGVELFSKH